MPDSLLPSRWTPQAAQAWYSGLPWLVGANYIPAYAINQLEMFQPETWQPAWIEREFALAASSGLNVLRIFLHHALWLADAPGFLTRLDHLLSLAELHGLHVMPVLFDSCWDPEFQPGPQRPPIPGVHNSGWVQSPGARALVDPTAESVLRDYVRGVIGRFAQDPRVLLWDLWNEPDNGFGVYAATEPPDKVDRVNRLLPEVFAWARQASPSQPLTSGMWAGAWGDAAARSQTVTLQLEHSDVLTFHNYDWPEGFLARVLELKPLGRPLLCTEYMARGAGSTLDTILPLAREHGVAALHWGLVAGKTQTWLPWDSWQRPYTLQPPTAWFHDLFRADGTPYRPHEIDLLRRLTGRGIS